MHVTVRGKRWELVFEKIKESKDHVGYCESPKQKNKKIVIHSSLSEQETLRVVCHELMHAAHWDLDEEAIDTASADIARVLWKLGYRRQE